MKITSDHECFMHKVLHDVELDETRAIVSPEDDVAAWKTGLLSAQRAFPSLNADEREILITGTCQEAWDSMFVKEPCDEDCDGESHPDLMCK